MPEKDVHYALEKDALHGEWFDVSPYSMAWLASYGIDLIPRKHCAACSCRLEDTLSYVKAIRND
jgi:hypothetical protein